MSHLHILSAADHPAQSFYLAETAQIGLALPKEAAEAMALAKPCKTFLLIQGCEALVGMSPISPEGTFELEVVWKQELTRFSFPKGTGLTCYEVLLGLKTDLTEPGAFVLLDVTYSSERVSYKIVKDAVLREG
ncbi:MAG TPA: hypothetical protein VNG90_04345 [Candidatus Acidoferrum sp.]|nr:hypothetical protein [Candidatus Acidoferrum sp.]